jgi:hypothetical protein
MIIADQNQKNGHMESKETATLGLCACRFTLVTMDYHSLV